MIRRMRWQPIALAVAISLAACAGTGSTDRFQVPSVDPFVGLLNKGITQLNININGLSKRITDAQQIPAGENPLMQELQALHLAGWQLHERQWVLQRDHLVLARDLLQNAEKGQAEKAQLLEQWRQHEQQYANAVDDLRQQRLSLEQKHLEVEARIVEQRLQ
ncbi:MAG TPA: hypothetical protein VJ746_01665 [Nitrospira sp.]|nr:hypothetical protein [Nitrospira sp.]